MNQYYLPFKPNDIVAELGGGADPRFHPNIDIRKMQNVDIVADFNKKLPIPDQSYNGIFSKYNLEHISWRRIRSILSEVHRILKPGGIAVFITANLLEQAKALVNTPDSQWDDDIICMIFGGQKFGNNPDTNEELEPEWDSNSHHAGFSPGYATKLMKEAGFESVKIIPIPTFKGNTDMVIEATKSQYIDINPISGDIKLNIGSFTVMNQNNWINIDILDLSKYAREKNYIFRQIDCSNGIPYKNNEVSLISASHFIEHLTRPQGKQFLKECFRVMKPGAIVRITVPDAKIIAEDYISENIGRHSSHNEGVKNAEDDAQSLFELLIAGHSTIYDYKSLNKMLSSTGFVDIEKMEYNKSKSEIMQNENIDMYPELSLYVEAVKPEIQQQGPIINYGYNSQNTIIPSNIVNINVNIDKNVDLKNLKIALISTPFFHVPPEKYGGLEQIVYDLAMGLDQLGHEVTVFAPEGSICPPNGHLVSTGPSIDTVNVDWYKEEERVYNSYKNIITPETFDIVVGHDWFGFEYLHKYNNPTLRVMHVHHGWYQWDTPTPFPKPNLVAISQWMKDNTEKYFKQKGFNINCKFVYNGVDINRYSFDPVVKKSDRLLYVGRFSRFKGAHTAIEVAKRANLPIDLIGSSFVDDPNYITQIESMCDEKNIVIYKDAPQEFKIKKLQEAKALLVPSNFGEPFGLTPVEGMACGCPIISTRDGAIPEIVINNRTGYICDTVEQMVDSIKNIDNINPEDCRKRAMDFSRLKMAQGYEKLFHCMIRGENW